MMGVSGRDGNVFRVCLNVRERGEEIVEIDPKDEKQTGNHVLFEPPR